MNNRGESLISRWYRSDIEEYIENDNMANVVEWFENNPRTDTVYEVDDELLADLSDTYLYNKAVETILRDNNTGGVIKTQSDLNYWLNDYHGHQQATVRSQLKQFLHDYDWVELPEEVEANA